MAAVAGGFCSLSDAAELHEAVVPWWANGSLGELQARRRAALQRLTTLSGAEQVALVEVCNGSLQAYRGHAGGPSAGALLQLLVQRLPVDMLMALCETRTPTREALTEALALRMQQLHEQAVRTGWPGPGEPGPEGWEGSLWGQWQLLVDQLYMLLQRDAVHFEGLVARLCVRCPRDTSFVWAISQCLSLDGLRIALVQDLTQQQGRLFSLLLSFADPQAATLAAVGPHAVRDSAAAVLAFRVKNASSLQGPTDPAVMAAIHARLPPALFDERVFDAYRQWWREREHRSDFDFHHTADKLALLSTLSSFTSQPVALKLAEFLHQPDLPTAPGVEAVPPRACVTEAPFHGKSRPLAPALLAALAVKSRNRLLDLLHAASVALQKPPATTASATATATQPVDAPGLLETYARLMYLVPSSASERARLHSLLREEQPAPRLQVLVELVETRLFRLCLHVAATPYAELKHVFLDAAEQLTRSSAPHPGVFLSLERLLLKVLQAAPSVPPATQVKQLAAASEGLARALVQAIARALKLRGSRMLLTTPGQQELQAMLLELRGCLVSQRISHASLQYMPAPLCTLFEAQSLPPMPVARYDSVYHEVRQLHLLRGALEATEGYDPRPLLQYYRNSPEKRLLLLPCAWMILLEQRGVPRGEHARPGLVALLADFSARELRRAQQALVEFVLDESPLQAAPLSHMGRAAFVPEAASPERLQEAAALLSWLVHVQGALQLESLLPALADRATAPDPNALALLQSLLFEDPCLRDRISFYCQQLQSAPRLDLEPEPFAKLRRYLDAFPLPRGHPSATLPHLFGGAPTQLLPALDLVLVRLIELEHVQLLDQFTRQLAPLYRYHDYPLALVRDTLAFYYENPMYHSFKLFLLRLLSLDSLPLSPAFVAFLQQGLDQPLLSAEYYAHLLRELARHLSSNVADILTAPPPPHYPGPLGAFEEIPCALLRQLAVAQLELLCHPPTGLHPSGAADVAWRLVAALLQPETRACPEEATAAALLVASLPSWFHQGLCDAFLQQMKALAALAWPEQVDASLLWALQHPDLDTALRLGLAQPSTLVLSLAQQFFHFGRQRLEVIAALVKLLREARPICAGRLAPTYIVFRLAGPCLQETLPASPSNLSETVAVLADLAAALPADLLAPAEFLVPETELLEQAFSMLESMRELLFVLSATQASRLPAETLSRLQAVLQSPIFVSQRACYSSAGFPSSFC
jgi:hypothetical protein